MAAGTEMYSLYFKCAPTKQKRCPVKASARKGAAFPSFKPFVWILCGSS